MQGLLWVKSRPLRCKKARPLYPPKADTERRLGLLHNLPSDLPNSHDFCDTTEIFWPVLRLMRVSMLGKCTIKPW